MSVLNLLCNFDPGAAVLKGVTIEIICLVRKLMHQIQVTFRLISSLLLVWSCSVSTFDTQLDESAVSASRVTSYEIADPGINRFDSAYYPTANPNHPLEKTLTGNVESRCKVPAVFSCFKNRGGEACWKRCGLMSAVGFCEMKPLQVCLKNGGGNQTCHARHCDGGGEGSFDAAAAVRKSGGSASQIVEIPYYGIGFFRQAYDPELEHYVDRESLEKLRELSKRVFRKTGYMVFVNDGSDKFGRSPGHSSHCFGRAIDIALMGNTLTRIATHYSQPNYSLNASKVLVNEARKIGGSRTVILFNDSRVPGRQYSGGHDNHYHISWVGIESC